MAVHAPRSWLSHPIDSIKDCITFVQRGDSSAEGSGHATVGGYQAMHGIQPVAIPSLEDVQTWNEKDARFSTLMEEGLDKAQQLHQYLNKNKFGALGRLLNPRSDGRLDAVERVVFIHSMLELLVMWQDTGYTDLREFDRPDFTSLVRRMLTRLNEVLNVSNGIPKR